MRAWDDVIDETARRLTNGQPRLGFTTRVVARLDEPRRRPRAWLLVSAAAVAIVVLAVVIPRDKVGETAGDVALTSEGALAELPDVGPKAEMPRPVRARPVTTPRVDPPADVTTDIGATFASELEPAPIVVPALMVAEPVVDALPDLEPLAIEEITIGALDIAQ